MSSYRPPVENMLFLLYDVLGFNHDEIDRETASAILEEAAKLAGEVLAPINKSGDEYGAKLDDGKVKTAPGFREAYTQYCEGGWNAVPFDPDYGGQGLPWALVFPLQEMWQAANMSFGLCPLLNQGAIEAITAHGSDAQKEFYLPRLISGEWTGTMNLTEGQAGSDLGLIKTKAEKQADGTYKISGQKIFITYGEHDLTENIIHLVLARALDAPDDVKGISLFIVPKILEDGTRNNLGCIGLEHKLGIHASPTCTMEFDSATGYLVGEENEGLKYMFTMMNNARLSVGLQGVAIAERALQHAQNYAVERVQGKSLETGERVSIDNHPDVKRMLLSMKAQVLAGRALAYEAALALDKAAAGEQGAQELVDLLTPIVKAWCTDMACDVASLGIQIHGGMGFIEETGAAQYYRDARILPIYEGTNGIQAMDLLFRKVLRDQGTFAKSWIEKKKKAMGEDTAQDLLQATDKLLTFARDKNIEKVAWYAVPYLRAFAIALGAAHLAELENHPQASQDIKEVSQFFHAEILPFARAQLQSLIHKF